MSTGHVAVAVDGSPTSMRALDRAAAEADRRQAHLVIVHPVSDLDEAGPVLDLAVARIRRRHPLLALRGEAVVGDLVEVLRKWSRAVDLTVVGIPRRATAAGALSGSAVRRVVMQCHGPLMVVPGEPGPCRTEGEDTVLLMLDGDDDADAAVFAFQEAARRGARLRVAHTWTFRGLAPPGGAGGTGPDSSDPAPGRVAARTRPARQAVSLDADRLIEASRQVSVAVIRSRRRWIWGRVRRPAAVRTLLRHAHCAVVFVPDQSSTYDHPIAATRPGG